MASVFCQSIGKNIDIHVGQVIENVYNDIVTLLVDAANDYVPCKKQNFYKYWWDEELKLLKSASINSHRVWVESGKPRTGDIFDAKAKAKLLYKNCVKHAASKRRSVQCF